MKSLKPRPRYLYSKKRDKIYDCDRQEWTNDKKRAKGYIVKKIP